MVEDGVSPGEEEGLELRHQNQAGWTAISREAACSVRVLYRPVPRGNLATCPRPSPSGRQQGQEGCSRQRRVEGASGTWRFWHPFSEALHHSMTGQDEKAKGDQVGAARQACGRPEGL
ncbi:hypothetical protein V8C35DRAFT_223935 [Trichoderma chlorosporum]